MTTDGIDGTTPRSASEARAWNEGWKAHAEWQAAQQSETLDLQERYFETLAKIDPSTEMAKIIAQARRDIARRQSETRITDEPAVESAIERASRLVKRYVEDHGPSDPTPNELASSLNDMIVYLKDARAALVAALEGEHGVSPHSRGRDNG